MMMGMDSTQNIFARKNGIAINLQQENL